jgi:hypothetical protein
MGNTDGGPAPVVKTVDPGDVTPNTNQGNSVDPQPRTVSNDV